MHEYPANAGNHRVNLRVFRCPFLNRLKGFLCISGHTSFPSRAAASWACHHDKRHGHHSSQATPQRSKACARQGSCPGDGSALGHSRTFSKAIAGAGSRSDTKPPCRGQLHEPLPRGRWCYRHRRGCLTRRHRASSAEVNGGRAGKGKGRRRCPAAPGRAVCSDSPNLTPKPSTCQQAAGGSVSHTDFVRLVRCQGNGGPGRRAPPLPGLAGLGGGLDMVRAGPSTDEEAAGRRSAACERSRGAGRGGKRRKPSPGYR